jgi:hypothetical protein
LWAQFDALKGTPVMVIRGLNSDLLSAATVNAMRQRHPDLTELAIAGQGHAPWLRDKASIDEVRLFLWGNNSGQTNGGAGPNGTDWGNLDLSVDNEWIAGQLATLGVTDAADVNLDGSVNNADVTAFLPDWRKVRRVNGVQVGDWTSRQDSDLNYDGIVDLNDAFILHEGLILAGSGSGFDFSLLGTVAPEPTSPVILVTGLLCVAGSMRRRQCAHGTHASGD